MWKWILAFFVISLLGCAGAGYYLYDAGKFEVWMQQMRPDLKGIPVRFSTITRGDLIRTVSAPGTVEPKTKVEVSSQVSARIIGLPFREGQLVKADDVVVRLDARDLAALVDSAKAQLKTEEARLEGARATFANLSVEFNRRKELYASKDIAKTELDQFEADYLRADSNLKAQQHAIEIANANIIRAEKDLDNTVITSPFDGIITRLDAEVGETVVVGTLNNPGSVIMEIADLGVMIVKTRIDEANIAPIKESQNARVFVNAYPDLVFKGTVDHVGLKKRTDTDGTTYFETDIILELPEGVLLRDGLMANADVQVETFRDIIKVPSQAVQDRAIDDLPMEVTKDNPRVDRTKKFCRVVFTMVDGVAKAVPVITGTSDLTDTVIMQGLEPGASIITGPYKSLSTLKHDQKVIDETTVPKKEKPTTKTKA